VTPEPDRHAAVSLSTAIGLLIGVVLCATALTPSFLHAGPCSRYDEQLGFTASSPTNPYGVVACCLFDNRPSHDVLPLAWLFGFLVAAFALMFRISKSRPAWRIAMVSACGVLAAGVIGFSASGLGLLLLFGDPGLYVAGVLVFVAGLLMATLDRRVAP
jgi:hypothetical protein